MSKYSYEFKKKVVSEYLKQLEEENLRRKSKNNTQSPIII